MHSESSSSLECVGTMFARKSDAVQMIDLQIKVLKLII